MAAADYMKCLVPPNLFAMLFTLSKHVTPDTVDNLEKVNLVLKYLAEAQCKSSCPTGYCQWSTVLPMGPCYGHRVRSIILPLSLLRYTQGMVTLYTDSVLLASFLESRDLSTSSGVLHECHEILF